MNISIKEMKTVAINNLIGENKGIRYLISRPIRRSK
jgi:hypothetical protein